MDLEEIDVQDNNYRVFITNKNVEALTESPSYGKGIHYYVTIGKMTCGKYNLYYARPHEKKANLSYRVYDTVDLLEEEFEILD